ncbi:MAG TPA: ABC transporter permease [Actinomycetota bacterium]|nr:ABC transporter permease [Actinomycetota bacterium]
MRLGWRELVRRPGRFVVAGGALTLIVVLLLLLGGLLDGLYKGSTGAFRSQSADVIVYAEESRNSLVRSRVEPGTLERIGEVEGVDEVSGLGVVLIGGLPQDGARSVDLAVFGYESPNLRVPAPPAPGLGYADRTLETDGVEVGDTIVVGPARVPVEIVGWVEDTRLLFQAGLWVEPGTWHRILETSRPDAALPEGTFQAALVGTDADPASVAAAIEREVPGTSALTIAEAIATLPGVAAQQETFVQIITVTFVVAGLVVALFFALLVLERLGLYGVLKAVGASSRQVAAGLVTQAVLVALGAFVVGGAVAVGLSFVIPEEVPVDLQVRRAVVTAVGLVATALLGSAISFRKIIRIDPASAVGGS